MIEGVYLDKLWCYHLDLWRTVGLISWNLRCQEGWIARLAGGSHPFLSAYGSLVQEATTGPLLFSPLLTSWVHVMALLNLLSVGESEVM